MSQHCIAVLSRKGGSGKTFTSIYTAKLLHSLGKDVAVLDLDPEGSALAWYKQGELPFKVYTPKQLPKTRDHAVLIIDTPPNDPKILGEAARMAQYVIVVSGANPLEADRLVPTLDALAASGFTGDWGILLTRVRGNMGKSMQDALTEAELPVLGMIPESVEYQRSFGEAPKRLNDYQEALGEFLP